MRTPLVATVLPFLKRAETPLEQANAEALRYAEAVRETNNAKLLSSANTDIRNAVLGALGAGVVFRGGQEALRQFRRKRFVRPTETTLPVIEKPASFMLGHDAKNKAGIPYYLPAMGIGTALAAYGGWKLSDMLADRVNAYRRKRRVEEAKTDFEDALVSQYEPEKKASDSTMAAIGRDLDELYRVTGKLVKMGFDVRNNAGTLLQAYGTYAGLSALLAGAVAAKSTWDDESKQEAFDKAVSTRKRRNYSAYRTPIEVQPERFDPSTRLTNREVRELTGG